MANPWDLQLVEVIQTAAGDDLDWRRTAVKALGNASDLEKVDIITAHSKRPSLAKDIIDKAIADYNRAMQCVRAVTVAMSVPGPLLLKPREREEEQVILLSPV